MAEVAFDFDLSVDGVQRVEADLSEESQSLFAAHTQLPSNVFLCLKEEKVIDTDKFSRRDYALLPTNVRMHITHLT